MTAELTREEARYTRTFLYALHGKPRQCPSGYHEIQPRLASITLDRDKEHEPWEVSWATIVGPRILTSGAVGVREETQIYTCHNGAVTDSEAPEWFVQLVADTYALAERERTGAALLATLPDPIDPEAIELGLMLSQCQSCPERLDRWQADDDEAVYAWHQAHYQATGHRKFWVWRVNRNEARVFTVPA